MGRCISAMGSTQRGRSRRFTYRGERTPDVRARIDRVLVYSKKRNQTNFNDLVYANANVYDITHVLHTTHTCTGIIQFTTQAGFKLRSAYSKLSFGTDRQSNVNNRILETRKNILYPLVIKPMTTLAITDAHRQRGTGGNKRTK